MSIETNRTEDAVPHPAVVSLAPPVAAPAAVARAHLFGAAGAMADAIARAEQSQREHARVEAQRISGNFYVDRLVGHMRTR